MVDSSVSVILDLFGRFFGIFRDSDDSDSGSDFTFISLLFLLFLTFTVFLVSWFVVPVLQVPRFPVPFCRGPGLVRFRDLAI